MTFDERLMQPVTWGMVFNSTWAGSGFTQVPGGPEWAEYSVLSYHYYCPLYDPQANSFDMYVCDDLMGPQVFNAIDQVTCVTLPLNCQWLGHLCC